jgi:hypothetical protein
MRTLFALLAIGSVCAATTARGQADELPLPVPRRVDFHKDVVAILANSCAKCHTGSKSKGGFSIDNRETMVAGGDSGAAVVIGNSAESRLVALVAGLEPDVVMPAQGPRLSAEQVGVLRAWIDQGLAWEAGFSFKRVPAAPLAPRRVVPPSAPAGTELVNPIDLLLAPYFAASGFEPAATVDDRTFLRRACLDMTGLIPTVEQFDAFCAEQAGDKRERLVRSLLDNTHDYAIHWLTFWNDALRNDYRGTGYIDGGRLQITDWLAGALADNMPYDQFVRELINPTPASAGFIKGIVWRGVVNASQVPSVQAAQNISQVFLGINLKCASCHDSFINDWKLVDAYGLAGIFADGPLEMHRCDQPIGQFAPMKFLYPELGAIDEKAPNAERLRQLAQVITRPENGRLARTIVNRLWSRLLGRGLVEPVDEMDNPPWSADLLDYLSTDLVDHGYDLKHTIELIATSRAYQLPSTSLPEGKSDDFVFHGPVVRRLSAEQFVDAASDVLAVEYAPAAAKVPPLGKVANRSGVRAALVNADPLLTALGRSNREQVVTDRPKTPTMLQALELTNGSPLSALVAKGAEKLARESMPPAQLVEQVYRRALLRPPSADERSLALDLLGAQASPMAIEDLLWAVLMLPEFQLIH